MALLHDKEAVMELRQLKQSTLEVEKTPHWSDGSTCCPTCPPALACPSDVGPH